MASEVAQGDDGMLVEVVGEWAIDKHDYLCRYLDASRGARKLFIGPRNAGATFADLFCAFGRSRIRDTVRFIDGSPVAAWKASSSGYAPFNQVYVADRDQDRREICARRLSTLNAPVVELPGDAVAAASGYRCRVNPAGLHLVFLDPHSLGALDFRIIEELSRLKRVDMLIHVSVMDMQRNLPGQLSDAEAAEFDAFAPGWREAIDRTGPQAEVRRRLLEHWSKRVTGLGMLPFIGTRLIKGRRGQRLYWLMLASRESLHRSSGERLVASTVKPKCLGSWAFRRRSDLGASALPPSCSSRRNPLHIFRTAARLGGRR